MRDSKGRFVKEGIPWNKGKKGVQIAWNKGYKCPEEVKKKISESLQGTMPWNKGKPHSEETKLKISLMQRGKIPWNKIIGETKEEKKERIRKYGQKNYPKYRAVAKKYHAKYYQQHRKSIIQKSKNWIQQNKDKRLQILIRQLNKLGNYFNLESWQYSWALQAWSDVIKKRDNNTCQICGDRAEVSHHILHKSKYPTISLNPNNGIRLCRIHHNEVHGWKGSIYCPKIQV